MRLAGFSVISLFGSLAVLACGSKEETPPQTPAQPAPAYSQQAYPQQPVEQQPQAYPQQPQVYPQQPQAYPQQPQAYPQPAPTTATPTPAPASTTSQPAAIAFPCQTDATCLGHKCDTTAGKCVWPCQTNNDCQAGFHCMAPQCVPGQ